MKPCIDPCPYTVSHMQCHFQTESFILLEDKIFICLVSPRIFFFPSNKKSEIAGMGKTGHAPLVNHGTITRVGAREEDPGSIGAAQALPWYAGMGG